MADLSYLQAIQDGLVEPPPPVSSVAPEMQQPPPPAPPPAEAGPDMSVAPPAGPNMSVQPGPNMSVQPPEPVSSVSPQQPTPDGIGSVPSMPEIRRVGGGKMIPAHEDKIHGKKYEANIDEAYAAQQGANDTAHVENRLKNQRTQAYAIGEQERTQTAADAAAAQKAFHDQEVRDSAEKYNSAIAGMSQNYTHHSSTIEDIGSIAGMMLALMPNIGHRGRHGPGNAGRAGEMILKYIDKNTERDLAEQKFNYEAGVNKESATYKQYQLMVQRYGSEAADASVKAAYKDAAAAKLYALGAANADNAEAATYAEAAGKLQADKAREAAGGFKFTLAAKAPEVYSVGNSPIPRTHTEGIAEEKAQRDISAKAGETVLTKDLDLRNEQAKEAKNKGSSEVPALKSAGGIELKGYTASSPQAAASATESRARAVEILDDIDKLKKIRSDQDKTTIGRLPTPGERQWESDAKGVNADLVMKIATQNKFRYSEHTKELIKEATGNPTAWRSLTDSKLDRLKESIARDAARQRESKGGGESAGPAPSEGKGGDAGNEW